jgi:hypothetical protein
MSPAASAGDIRGGGAPEPLSRCEAAAAAADDGTCIRGDKMRGAPSGVDGVLIGVFMPGTPPGPNNRCDSAAAANSAKLRHSSSDTATWGSIDVSVW